MAPLTFQEARGLIVADPHSGWQIPHVVEVDPDKKTLTTYMIEACTPGGESVMRSGEVLPYRFISMGAMGDAHTYSRVTHDVDYDLVDKATGEVVREVRTGARFGRTRMGRLLLLTTVRPDTRERWGDAGYELGGAEGSQSEANRHGFEAVYVMVAQSLVAMVADLDWVVDNGFVAGYRDQLRGLLEARQHFLPQHVGARVLEADGIFRASARSIQDWLGLDVGTYLR